MHLKQLKRITEHFKNSKFLIEKLDKQKNWHPKGVVSLLLYGCKYGKPTKDDNTYVANETDVYNFFNKTPIGKWEIDTSTKRALYKMFFLENYDYLSKKNHLLNIKDFYHYMEFPMALKYISESP